MRLNPLPPKEYARRITRLQEELKKEGLDALIGYSSECESDTIRYLTGFWPFFDFSGIIVPAGGKTVVVTGGPESLEFAKVFSSVPDIRVNPLFVETSAPEWVPQVSGESFVSLLPKVCGGTPKRIGVANWNIFPHIIFEDLKKAAPKAEFVPADEILLKVKMIKSDVEIPYICSVP
jgi:Xaa-Pro aminopeptidase